jgi:predicted ATPase
LKAWLKRIRNALGTQWGVFVSLLSDDARRLINEEAVVLPAIESEKFLTSFRSWLRRFLQLFGTPERPLILIVDDTQWLMPDEIEVWRDLLDGNLVLNHVLVIYMTRSHGSDPPPQRSLLSSCSTCIPVNRLTEEGVNTFINTCLNGRVSSSGDAIASFLSGETGGSPLFLQTLLTTLLKEQVVRFDYDALQWRFDLISLQSHLSDASFDSYLENMMRKQPSDVQEVLMVR